jgi:hypothetical protein
VTVNPPPVAVIFLAPWVLKVMVKDPTPLVRVIGTGSSAAPSVEVIVTMLLKLGEVTLRLSLAVIVKVNGVPAEINEGVVEKVSLVAGAETAIVLEFTVFTPSVAVNDLFPDVFKVIEKVPTPFVNFLAAGNTAAASPEVKETVPA